MKRLQVITIDRGIPIPGEDEPVSLIGQCHDKVLSMEIGDSFFLEDTFAEHLRAVIHYADTKLNMTLLARDTDSDEVYLVPGVRVWRIGKERMVTEPVVDLNETYWKNKHGVVISGPKGARPNGDDWVQIARAEYLKLLVKQDEPAEQETYWYHAESDTTFALPPGEEPGDPLCEPINKDEFLIRMKLEETEFGGNYWKDPKGPVVVEWLPGRYPDPKMGHVRVTKAEYVHYWNTTLPQTYWRRADGSCTVVPREKLEKAMKTPGAVQISVNEYNAWKSTQDEEL